MIRTTSPPSSKYFQYLFIAPDALTALFPAENVYQERAERCDADHQKCSRQNNMFNHDNLSFVVVARA